MSKSHDLTVSAPQGVFLSGLETKFKAYVGGFGSGKTFVGCLDLLLFAGAHPKLTQGYFAPTYRDIRDTFWPTLEEAADLLGFHTVVKRADKEVDIFRGRAYYGTIVCRSMDDPGAIVGFKIARALVDEIDILTAEKAGAAWRKIIARMRLVVPGVVNGIGVTTTPEGFKFVYDQFYRTPTTEKDRIRRRDYAMVQASTYENEKYLPPDYIPSLVASYPQELIDAYLMGQFVNLTAGTVYRCYDRVRCRSTETIKPREPLHIGQDFNVGQMASVVCVQRDQNFHAVEELQGIQDTPHLIEVLGERYPDHALTIYPDASGGARKTVDASRSDISILRAAKLTVLAHSKNPFVKDRVLAMNAALEKGKLFVNDAKCPKTAEALEQQAYDKNGEPDKTAGFDHHADALGYLVNWHMPLSRGKIKTNFLR